MPSRFKSRQQALQMLYLWDVRQQPMADVVRDFYGPLSSHEDDDDGPPERDGFGEHLAMGTVGQFGNLDEIITRHSQHWRIERMPVVDRNILRLAIFEMKTMATPSAVIIDQALELARRFSSEESIGFLNGVLDAVNHTIRPMPPGS
ncbi:MAG: transcription antitermination factor NusB [Bryobacterales bacterium]|nr:transcription antitermination factor NusB [Bryobacterales bacterium]